MQTLATHCRVPSFKAQSAKSRSHGAHAGRLVVKMHSHSQPLQKVQAHAIMHEGKQYVPLSEAQRFYEAGVRSGAVERIEMLEKKLQEVEEQRDELLAAMQEEYSVHEKEMKQLLRVALALEQEIEIRTAETDQVAELVAQEAEERLGEYFAAQLKALHDRDMQEAEEHMHQRIEAMGHALRTALAGKEGWRRRALEAEKQLAQLRGAIESQHTAAQEGARRVGKQAQRGGSWKQVNED